MPPISPDHQDGFGLRIVLEHLQEVDERGADDRIAAQADAGRLPQPQIGELPDGFVGERAAAADDADGAGLVNVAGHDADLALPRRDDAGTVGPDQPAGRSLIKR